MVSVTTPAALRRGLPELARKRGRTRTLALGALAATVVVALLLAFLWDRTINHDTAWYLISTRRWLEGARLYTDLYDVNPPLASYLTVPAILAADLFSISDVNGQYVAVAVLTGLSLFWSWTILIDRVALTPARQAFALFGLAAVLIVPALALVGQREHLMLLLVLPWLLGQIPGPRGTVTGRVLRAGVAAIGLCLKPYFLTIPLCVILWQALRDRSLRPFVTVETTTMLAMGLLYVGAARLLHPEYFTEIVPTARQVYLSFGSSTRLVFARLAFAAAPFLPFLVLLTSRWRSAAVPAPFVAGMTGGLASYIVQWKGFDYHILPFESFALLATLWVLLRSERATPFLVVTALTAATAVTISSDRGTYDYRLRPFLEEAMGDAPRPKSLFAATNGVEAGALFALEIGADWASRYPQNWLVPGAINGLAATDCAAEPDRCASLQAILERSRDDNIADIEAWRPEAILIDKRRGFVENDDFSWYDYFEGNPRWTAIIASYKRTGSTANFDVWTRSAAGR